MIVRTTTVLSLSAMLCVVGCATTVAVGYQEIPAAVPVQTFPYIVLLEPEGSDAEYIQLQVFEELRRGPSHVEVLTVQEFEERRESQDLAYPGVVVSTRLNLEEGYEDSWGQIRQTPPRGVLTSSNVYRGRRARWAVVEATLVVTVTDARGGEQLQRHRIFARDEGSDFALMRRTVLERLAVNLVEDLQVRRQAVNVPLRRVPDAENNAAILLAREGQWTEAERIWRRLCVENSAAERVPEERAALLYNWAMSMRFAEATERGALRDAQEHLLEALSLDPQREYLEALQAVRRQQEGSELRIRQRQSRTRNFEMAGPGSFPEPSEEQEGDYR